MKLSRIKSLSTPLLHPLTLSLAVTAVLAWILFSGVPRYELKIMEQIRQSEDLIVHYDDFDGNGYDDKLVLESYGKKLVGVTLHMNPAIGLKEWPFRGQYHFYANHYFTTADYNHDTIREIGLFTISNDSLLFNMVIGAGGKYPSAYTRFVCLTDHDSTGKGPYLNIIPGGWEDLNGDGYKEYIFATMFGYSSRPRNIYACDIHNDSLMVSPDNGYHIVKLELTDLDGDGTREILVNGYAGQTHTDSTRFRTHDHHCWLMALDRNLQYLFPPVPFPLKGYSSLNSRPYSGRDGKKRLFGVYCPPLDSAGPSLLCTFSADGCLLKTKPIPGVTHESFSGVFPFSRKGTPFMAITTADSGIWIFDTALALAGRQSMDFELAGVISDLDLDGDGENEIAGFDYPKNNMTVLRHDLRHPAGLSLPLGGGRARHTVSLFRRPGKAPLISLNNGNNDFLLEYRGNLFYYTRWLAMAGIFLAIYLFALVTGRLQKLRIEKRLRTEKKITELQLKIVRNQMDPHFTMNAVNAVIDAVNREEKEQAREHLLHFSKMYRSLVLSADKIKRTLQEEIDFTENYLALEQFRFGNRFSYQIRIDEGVDLTREIPKMAIQSPVENAVKHGFAPLPLSGAERGPGGEALSIHAFMDGPALVIEITDNGIGREAARREGSSGTGKGMEIMQQFFDLYRQVTGVHVTSEIADLEDEQGNPSGTRVRVTVPG